MMSKLQLKTATTIGKNDSTADYNTADFANDSACFQAAIDQVFSRGGGTICIKQGSYTMAAIVNYKSNVNIEGDGYNTIINQSTNFTQKLSNISNIKISNILIDAINMTAGNFYGLYMENVIDITLDNVKVINAKGFAVFCGATISGLTENIRFLNCHLEGLGTSDVLGGGPAGANGTTTGSVRNIVVDNCRVYQNSLVGNFHKDAINFVKAENIKITNCTTKGSILWGSEQGPHINSIISKNTVYNAGGTSRAAVGLIIDSAVPSAGGNILIEGNIIKDGFIDIFNNIVGSKLNFLKITGNTIKGTGLTDANNESAILLINVDQSTIVDNIIEQSNTTGIKLVNSQYNNIFLNKINSTLLFGYQETGTSNNNIYELNTNFNNVTDIDTTTLGANTKVNQLLLKADDLNVVHKTGTETVANNITFTGSTIFANPFILRKATGSNLKMQVNDNLVHRSTEWRVENKNTANAGGVLWATYTDADNQIIGNRMWRLLGQLRKTADGISIPSDSFIQAEYDTYDGATAYTKKITLAANTIQLDGNVTGNNNLETRQTTVSLSALTVGTTAVFPAVPAGKTLVLTKVFFRPTTVTGTVTAAPSLSIGANATTFDDFMPTTQLTGGVTLTRGYTYIPLFSMPIYPAGSVVTVQVDTAPTGTVTALTYAIDLFGYFI